jgi:UDP-N-acetylglucosamine transferase subunit ALG13
MSFDRLIRAVHGWASAAGREEILVQVGPGGWRPEGFRAVELLAPLEFRQRVQQARVVVSHAGMGTVLTALELGKPLLVMPRRGDLKETRNDHQIATARQLAQLGRATVAYDEDQLVHWLGKLDELPPPRPINAHASPKLISRIRHFISGETLRALVEQREADSTVGSGGRPAHRTQPGMDLKVNGHI